MKKKLMMLSAAIVMSLATFAQGGPGQGRGGVMTPEQIEKRNAQRIESIEKAVGTLSAEEKTKVQALFNENAAQMAKLHQTQSIDSREQMAAMRKDSDAKLKAILGEDRFAKYDQAMREERETQQRKGQANATSEQPKPKAEKPASKKKNKKSSSSKEE